ncbi:VPS35 endosomal protein sorting factor-like [Pseudolycoriella hygida]|uniref:VPS35 endosomal protein sorting factor-like n=1 Tax=Pseudolycoriella hygida TaxID=35572 RepID=A0A9Q0MR89_9DIPT|nr:VPS35 endosomal protein sorting factor-like [Pseudolycoriella hygida]
MSSDWHCIVKDRDPAACKKYFTVSEVVDHPLKAMTVTVVEGRNVRKLGSLSKSSSTTSSTISLLEPFNSAVDGSDPLTLMAKQDVIDPLSQMVAEEEEAGMKLRKKGEHFPENAFDSWHSRRTMILTKFTTSEKLSIVTSFLTGGEIIKTQQATISEKVKHRLEQLDDFESIHQMLDLTQQEYVSRIEQLNNELVQAWNSDQRVKSLKIAIQCSKLLADTSVMQFYPSQFVLVTDILDIFGKLVYERLISKAEYFEPGKNVATKLPDNFTPEMVSESAKETCLNWFYKVASIRELLPRLYVEIAIIKSYRFLNRNDIKLALERLTKIIRGIGDPLVAAYARCYLCRVGMTVTTENEYIYSNLTDFLSVYHTIFGGGIRSEILRQRMDLAGYLTLYTPSLDWLMQATSNGSDVLLDEILTRCQEKKNNGLLLNSIMTSFKPNFIANRAEKFVTIISNSATEGVTKAQLFRSLGLCLSQCPPPIDQRLSVLTGSWKTIKTLTHVAEYISCVEPWAQYTAMNFNLHEVNNFLGDVLSRLNQNRAFENHYAEMHSIVDKVVTYAKSFEGLLISDHFLPIIDLFQKESVKLEVCKSIMSACRDKSENILNDPVVINALMYICKVLNDTVNALTVEDERRQISALICDFIKKVDFGRDFEQQLTFYVEARAAFPNLDLVFINLVHCVNKLAVDTRCIVNGHHTRKTGAFIKACAAYCYITIPSIVSVMARMDLYLLSGQVALTNVCLGQADACFYAALQLVPELPKMIDIDGKLKNTEPYLVSFLCNFLSTLIVVPDSPEQGVLYLLRTLLDVIKRYPFDPNSASLSSIYMAIIDMLTTAAQDTYPYHIPNVVSNDELYGSDSKFIAEIDTLCSQCVDLMLVQLKLLGDNLRLQSNLALELFVKIVYKADVCREKMFALAANLWNLAMKNKSSLDPKLPGKILMRVERFKGKTMDHKRHALEELTTKMKLKM